VRTGDAGIEEAARLWRELCGDRLGFAEPPELEVPKGLPAAPGVTPNPALVLSKFRLQAVGVP
jgi:hypothetical protein